MLNLKKTLYCASLSLLLIPCSAKDIYKNRKKVTSVIDTIHPYFALENIDSTKAGTLKVGGMCFDGETLYLATLSPDRTNKKPDHQGKVLKLENVLQANGKERKLKVTPIVSGLYEPCAITVVGEHIYVGTKTQILRFDGATKTTGGLKPEDATVLLDGLSDENFHTYTVGFEEYRKDGKLYLCGNFTTAIVLGGKRGKLNPAHPDVKRGSTFLLGPITGTETAQDLTLEYIAGGYRTPNGVEVGPDNEVYVADNQGIFNPANELIRLEQGGFYGHYLYKEGGRAAAFQPEETDPEKGGTIGQKPATILLPQGTVARSPAQPHVIHGRKGVLAPYNGQILLCEFTTGSILRVFTEEVDGVWQGATFKHSGGLPNKEGNDGFTGGPNRLVEGPDGNYYVGEIGAGGLWAFNGTSSGLQRFRVKPEEEVDPNFNEILAVRVVEGGFEVEFLKPIDPKSIDKETMAISQWTYIPTSRYGGAPFGTEKLKVKELSFDSSFKKATLLIDGLKDGSPQYVLKERVGTSANTGWVVHVELNPAKESQKQLYTSEFWYTLHKKKGGKDLSSDQIVKLSPHELAEQKYQSLCVSCHVARGDVWAAPDLKGILGRKQTVLRKGKEVEVVVDRKYIINSIMNPESEKVLEYKDAYMADLGIKRKEAEVLADYILNIKK